MSGDKGVHNLSLGCVEITFHHPEFCLPVIVLKLGSSHNNIEASLQTLGSLYTARSMELVCVFKDSLELHTLALVL